MTLPLFLFCFSVSPFLFLFTLHHMAHRTVPHCTTLRPLALWLTIRIQVWQKLSPTMYMAFWAFSQYDINVPVNKYEAELKRLKDKSKVLLMSPPPPSTDKKANQNRSDDTKRLLTGW